jgi:hypothetical protein
MNLPIRQANKWRFALKLCSKCSNSGCGFSGSQMEILSHSRLLWITLSGLWITLKNMARPAVWGGRCVYSNFSYFHIEILSVWLLKFGPQNLWNYGAPKMINTPVCPPCVYLLRFNLPSRSIRLTLTVNGYNSRWSNHFGPAFAMKLSETEQIKTIQKFQKCPSIQLEGIRSSQTQESPPYGNFVPNYKIIVPHNVMEQLSSDIIYVNCLTF